MRRTRNNTSIWLTALAARVEQGATAIRVGVNGFGRMRRLSMHAGWVRAALACSQISEVACDAGGSVRRVPSTGSPGCSLFGLALATFRLSRYCRRFFADSLGWHLATIGAALALRMIGYGVVPASAPKLLRANSRNAKGPGERTARGWAFVLEAIASMRGHFGATVLVCGLLGFGVLFVVDSAVYLYLILAYSDVEWISLNVGHDYMANAGGRVGFSGPLLSGWTYCVPGVTG